MAENTAIEWCDSTFNPWVGCTKIAPACDHCYAESWAKRSGMVEWGNVPRRRTSAAAWHEPTKWQRRAEAFFAEHGRRRRVFCASLADVFDNQVPSEWRADLWALIRECPDLDWLLLTKRPQNIGKMLPAFWDEVKGHVWLGTTVEDQARANQNIPHLLQHDASVRFASIEPMLAPINLRAALRPKQPFRASELPAAWADFLWPEWIPQPVRGHIVDFWRESYGRGPAAWLRDAITQGGPALWTEAEIRALTAAGEPLRGRFIHLWNNIGCVVGDDGSYSTGSFPSSSIFGAITKHGRGLDWIIAGGESGPQARPSHPDWFRSLRDQCAAAGVPFLFKQWGEWAPGEYQIKSGGLWFRTDDGREFPGRQSWQAIHHFETVPARRWPAGRGMAPIGKKAAGRLLDGVEHNGFLG